MADIKNKNIKISGFSTPEGRWARLGPYYAMFPLDFAVDVIEKYSNKNDKILDPFAGRGTSIYAAGLLGRKGTGIEISPLGWLYGTVKLHPAPAWAVEKRLKEIYNQRRKYARPAASMPKFFHACFNKDVLQFLLAARDRLHWKTSGRDAALMALLCHYLHGRRDSSLSNQMQLTKAMGMEYSLLWWKKNNMLKPPALNPLDFIRKRIQWRYENGVPKFSSCEMKLGDSTKILPKMAKDKYSLLFTSPPYYSITDYHSDQWLRLWLLGNEPKSSALPDKHKGRFGSKIVYQDLLDTVFKDCANLVKNKSVVYVRTDAREFTFTTTLAVLKKYFPKHKVRVIKRPLKKRNQTEVFGNKGAIRGEIDIILTSK